MARLKSAYRPKPETPPEPEVEKITASEEAPAPAPPADEKLEKALDDASLALRAQIGGLKHSAELQRQRASMSPREQRLAEWQAQGAGLSPDEVEFFRNNPALVDHPQITAHAIAQAKQAGHQRGTAEHLAAVKEAFDATLAHLQAEAAKNEMPASTPEFFAPPPAQPARSGRRPTVSAPVSRSIPTASGSRPKSGTVRLTPSEVEAARISGLSVEQYAKEKLRYQSMREAGEYRDGRD